MAKRPTLTPSDSGADALIRQIGAARNRLDAYRAAHDERLAALNTQWRHIAQPIEDEIAQLVPQLRSYCEEHRDRLTGGSGKTAKFWSGEVRWRRRPPRLQIDDADELVEQLRRLGLERFVRLRTEPDRHAMLAEPDAIRHVAGVERVEGDEEFVVLPFPGP